MVKLIIENHEKEGEPVTILSGNLELVSDEVNTTSKDINNDGTIIRGWIKSSQRSEIIERARKGNCQVIKLVLKEAEEQILPMSTIEAVRLLTKTEVQVLKAHGQGLSYHEIAEKLHKSYETIKTHSSNIFLKLNVKNKAMAYEALQEFMEKYPDFEFGK